MSAKLFLGGVPTKPDVDRLRQVFGVPEVGNLIRYDAIEDAIGCKRQSDRFKTVVWAWRRAMKSEHRVIMAADPGKGLVRLDDDGKAELACAMDTRGFRQVRRAFGVAQITDRSRLSDDNRRALDHLDRRNASIRLALATGGDKKAALPDIEKK